MNKEVGTMKPLQRQLAALLFVCCLLSFALPFLFAGEHIDHECRGEPCAICHYVRQLTNTITYFAAAAAPLLSLGGLLRMFRLPVFAVSPLAYDTPITLKVQLNN